jgi:hypothetical protein
MTQSSIFLTFPLTITFFLAILRVSKIHIHTLMRERLQKYCIILQYFLLMLLACYLRLSHAYSTLFNTYTNRIELLIYLIDAVEVLCKRKIFQSLTPTRTAQPQI